MQFRRLRATGVLFAGLIAATLLTPAVTAAAPAGPLAATTVPIGQLVQEQNQWCWVASGLTIARTLGYGTSVSQNTFCDYGRGYPAGSQCPNQAGQLTYVQRAYQMLGLSPGSVTSALSFSSVQSEINARRPIETGIYWTAGGGHAQVIYGYDSASQLMYYGDPWPTSQRYSAMSYSSYVRNGQFQWAQSLYRIGA
ncbi:papain-like cysteine protease family protein [Amycolatopsis sp. H20-H5]|uniref:papain-like cysteine protease family protein n=1 Tax=Amycolatopsis sp. H20-H5 TaxID=3046309 RepID=UPI002DBC4098|nr:papain-like cysteine protease family protein [Amycolatopsis sp. H20-H5]MEC3982744.1 papain-like cysteine protease family protein [Amycolatopsis sp. H20-H5]